MKQGNDRERERELIIETMINMTSRIIHDIIEKVSVLIALRDASEYNHGKNNGIDEVI